jgi:hypothetical protein
MLGRDGKVVSMSTVDNRADRMAQVRAQVAYHGQRLVMYQRLHGSRPSTRLADLEHAYDAARERLAGASVELPAPAVPPTRPL